MKCDLKKYGTKLIHSIRRGLSTRRGKNLITYSICFLIAYLIWLVISLDTATEREYDLPVKVTNLPDSVVIVGEIPPSINVILKGKGTQFFKYHFTGAPSIDVDFRQYADERKWISMSRSKLDSKIRELFGQNVLILAVHPDSFKVGFTAGNGIRVPVRLNSQSSVSPSSKSLISGPMILLDDTVSVYTVGKSNQKIRYIETEVVNAQELTDTTIVEVALKVPTGMCVKPERVRVMIPAELLVSKSAVIPINVINTPEHTKVYTYPSSLEIRYLAPMRLISKDFPARLTVDYRNISSSSQNVKVEISALPGSYKIVSISQDSVEYVVER